MARFGLPFVLISSFALGCSPADLPDATGSVDDPSDLPADTPSDDPPTGDEPEADPLNLSFEWPRLGELETAKPTAWETAESGSAGAFAIADPSEADHGDQYAVLQLDGSGRSTLFSPPLAVLEQGSPVTLTFALRSDCEGAVVTLLAGEQSGGFAVLPTPSTWSDVSFGLQPTADNHGLDFAAEITVSGNTPCAVELDDVRVR